MTCKERVYAALRFEEADIIPYNISIDPPVAERLDAYYGGRENWPKYENHFAGLGWEIRAEELGTNTWRDPFGVVWQDGTIFHITEPVLPEPDLEGLQVPEIIRDSQVPEIEAFCRQHADKFTLYSFGMLFFERAWALRGMENLLMDFHLHPEFVNELLDLLMQLHLDALDKILHLKALDCIQFGDDYGQQCGLLMGPPLWREFLKPRLARMYGKVRDAGKVVAIHSCGDNTPILEDLIEIGLQILNPFQPEAMDVFAIKRQYGQRLVFNGGIGTQRALPHGTPDQVREEIWRAARELGRGGGYIMETTKPLRPEVPTENAAAALETIIEAAHHALRK